MTVTEEAGGQLALVLPGQERLEPEPCDTYCPHGDKVERDRWDRPLIGGQPKTRASTLAGTLEDGHALEAWKMRQVLLGATETDLREAKRLTEPSDLNHLAQQALERAGGQDGARDGTTAHHWAAQYAMDPDGLPWDMLTDEQAGDVLALADGLRAEGLRFTPLVEQFVAGPEWAGTFDFGLQDHQGRWWLADLKTGAKDWDRKYPSRVAVQLAAYGRGRRWCPEAGYLWTPKWQGYLLLSVPLGSGECHVTEVKKRSARAGLTLARNVRAWRARKSLARPYKV